MAERLPVELWAREADRSLRRSRDRRAPETSPGMTLWAWFAYVARGTLVLVAGVLLVLAAVITLAILLDVL